MVSLGPGNCLAWVGICPLVFGIDQLFLASQTLLPWTVFRERKVRANALVQYTWEGDRTLCLIVSEAIWQGWICRKLCLKTLWLWGHLSSLGRKRMAYFTWSFQNLSPAADQDWSQRLWHAWQSVPQLRYVSSLFRRTWSPGYNATRSPSSHGSGGETSRDTILSFHPSGAVLVTVLLQGWNIMTKAAYKREYA